MSEFKLGDLVKRIADPEHDYRYMRSGEIYTVTNIPACGDDLIQVDNYSECWDMDKFELYQLEPTELEEAYAKIDTLESALEDAVRQLISLREGNNTAVIDVNQEGFKPVHGELKFKPISEYTLEDWELAKEEGWVFESNNGKLDTVEDIDHSDNTYPVCFADLRWKTQSGYDTYFEDDRREYDVNIIKRIK